jgi:hypothetical protein
MAAPKKPPKKAMLKGSKAAPGPSKASANKAANIGAYHAGKNYTAKGVSRTGYQPAKPAPAPTPQRRGPWEGAMGTGLTAPKGGYLRNPGGKPQRR